MEKLTFAPMTPGPARQKKNLNKAGYLMFSEKNCEK